MTTGKSTGMTRDTTTGMTTGGHTRRTRRRRTAALAALLALALLITAVLINGSGSVPPRPLAGGTSSGGSSNGASSSGSATSPSARTSDKRSLATHPAVLAQPAGLRLSAGHAQQPAAAVAVVDGRPLAGPQIAAVVDRLPAWTGTSASAQPFKWPAQTITAPQAGRTVALGFPGTGTGAGTTSGGTPQPTPTGPLHVLRMQPQGPVAIAPFVSITFDQPMVPITTIGRLTAAQVPAKISPAVAGTWQWIGTSTLRFAAHPAGVDRLPMATDFTVTVPAGTRAAGGAMLAKAATFRFSTPPPTVQKFQPTGASMARQPVFLAVFDQRVDAPAVLRSVTLRAGGKTWPIRLATAAEVAADPAVSSVIGAAPAGRVLTFRPIRALPVDAVVSVTVAAGTPSAEGPRRTTAEVGFLGHTYAGLKLQQRNCGYGRCQPSADLTLQFNNALDAKSFDPETIRISPQIPGGASVSVSGNVISIQGATAPDTTYTITVPTTVVDVFGQKLAAPAVATLTIGPATPRLDPFPTPVTTLDPLVDQPSITVNTLNRREFRERVFAVSPTDWTTYQRFYVKAGQQDYSRSQTLTVPSWPVLVDRIVTIGGLKNALVSTRLDLSKVLPGPGHVVVLIEPTARENFDRDDVYQNQPTMTWAQSTTLGLDAQNDATQLRAWVTDLRSGSPLPGVQVGMVGSDGHVDPAQSAATGADGVAALSLTSGGAGALLATRGNQSALLPSQMWSNSWRSTPTRDQLLWFVDDDRQTYRPGETVSVKGWVRRQGSDVVAALGLLPTTSSVAYTARDGYGNAIGHGTAKLSALGGFDLTVKIPAGANLGAAWIDFRMLGVPSVDSNGYQHTFAIADFRTPDFQVDTHGLSGEPGAQGSADGSYVVGDDLTVAAAATYYAGGPLGAAPVNWQVRTAVATYAPPGWDTFTFGIWTPWWQTGPEYSGSSMTASAGPGYCCQPVEPDTATVDKFAGITDSGGSNYLQVRVGDLGAKYAGLPVTLTAQATVTDANRQAIAGTADLLVHPSDFYVGISSDQTFITQGKDFVVQAIATGIDGKAAPGRAIVMQAAKVTTSYVNGASVDTESDPQPCQVTSGTGPVSCTFHPSAAGTYRITATITDDRGRVSRSQLTRWVAGTDSAVDSSVQLQQLTLVPDKQQYQPGESAKLLVQSPIRAGTGLITVVHHGIVTTSRFAVANGSAVVGVPITTADIPGVTASIEVVGTAPRPATDTAGSGTPRPAYATGQIDLTVSTQARTLEVTAVPRQKSVAPGGSTSIDVTVTDQSGKPVPGSEFELVVADEAVLALGGYALPDPIKAFYPALPDPLVATYGRSLVMLSDPPPKQQSAGGQPEPMSSAAAASGAAQGSAAPASMSAGSTSTDGAVRAAAASSAGTPASAPGAPIADRTDFDPLALFLPSATTDANGHATIPVTLPDNLTRYRVMLVAVAGAQQFGSTEATITAALRLTVRPSAPQFLNFGDRLELPVLVQNQTAAPLTTDVVIQAANLKIDGPAGQQVTVPANGRIEVRFPVSADQAGTAKFRVAAVSGIAADSATVELPVYTPTTTETFATYGVVSSGSTVLQPVTAPKGVVPQFGGLQISTSSTALQQLTDAVAYLADYDYDSSDALAGQIIAIGSLADVLKAFSAPGLPAADTLRALVVSDVAKLGTLQNGDGGFPYWRRGDKSDPFNSIQSTQALLVAAKNGFTVSKTVLARAQQFLGNIDAHIPSDASQTTKDTLHAYALNVRTLGGHRDPVAAQALVTQRGAGLPLDAVAWLLPAVTDAGSLATLERRINNAAVDDAGSATFTNAVTDDAWTTLQSDRRTDGLILDALITVDPSSDLIPKVVSGLMAGQTGGRWDNVQENAFILLALRHYYDAFESTSADFVAGVWLGARFAGQHQFQGHTTDRATVTIPTANLLAAKDSDVTLRNEGTGRLYYRLGLQTAPTDLELAPLDRGFVVSRSYEAVDDPADVTQDSAGTWHIRAGAQVRVRLTLVSRSAQTHVALTDPLPAGLQIQNPDLATTSQNLDPKAATSSYGSWYDHQNLRADRAEAFATYLQGGVYDYSYLTTATTEGTFVVPPPRAQEVYAPETFGRGGSDRVVIGAGLTPAAPAHR